jgi:anti-anti-sigma factor
MEFNTEIIDDVTIVELKMDVLDANNAREFKENISPVLEENQKVVFDMSQVGFLDSSGYRLLPNR